MMTLILPRGAMRPSLSFFLIVVTSMTTRASAQGVMVARATAEEVVVDLKSKLLPQGFQLQRSDAKSALFTLDRGMVAQEGSQYVRGTLVHIVIELTARFKQKQDSLQVTASEVVVGNPRASMGFRKPVQTHAELDNMQRLLETVKADLEARKPTDSTTGHDSTSAIR